MKYHLTKFVSSCFRGSRDAAPGPIYEKASVLANAPLQCSGAAPVGNAPLELEPPVSPSVDVFVSKDGENVGNSVKAGLQQPSNCVELRPLQHAPRSRVEYTSADELVRDVQDLRWLGQGAQGVVYEGCWQGATVAVKFSIVEDLDTTAYELLFSRLLSHPNVVQTFVAKIAVLDEKTIYPATTPDNSASTDCWRAHAHTQLVDVRKPGSLTTQTQRADSATRNHGYAAAAGSALYQPTTATSAAAAAQGSPAGGAGRRFPGPHPNAAGPAPARGGGGGGPKPGSPSAGAASTVRGFDLNTTSSDFSRLVGFGAAAGGGGGGGSGAAVAGRGDSFHSDDGFGDPFGRRSTFTDVREVLASMGAKPGHYITQMVMEHCDHGSLHSAIQRGIFKPASRWGPKLALRALIRTVREVAQGMFHLHSNNVLHGDLKPANVLLINSRKDRRGYIAKVSDFGLAQFCSQDHISNAPWGTLVYMAPERLLHGQLFAASDVYSFGVMLWEMYHGQRPYEGMHVAQIVMACAQGSSALEWMPDACEDIVRISRRCTVSSPRDRPTFETLMRELAHLEARVRLEGPRISTSLEANLAATAISGAGAAGSSSATLRRSATTGNPQRMSTDSTASPAALAAAAALRRCSHDQPGGLGGPPSAMPPRGRSSTDAHSHGHGHGHGHQRHSSSHHHHHSHHRHHSHAHSSHSSHSSHNQHQSHCTQQPLLQARGPAQALVQQRSTRSTALPGPASGSVVQCSPLQTCSGGGGGSSSRPAAGPAPGSAAVPAAARTPCRVMVAPEAPPQQPAVATLLAVGEAAPSPAAARNAGEDTAAAAAAAAAVDSVAVAAPPAPRGTAVPSFEAEGSAAATAAATAAAAATIAAALAAQPSIATAEMWAMLTRLQAPQTSPEQQQQQQRQPVTPGAAPPHPPPEVLLPTEELASQQQQQKADGADGEQRTRAFGDDMEVLVSLSTSSSCVARALAATEAAANSPMASDGEGPSAAAPSATTAKSTTTITAMKATGAPSANTGPCTLPEQQHQEQLHQSPSLAELPLRQPKQQQELRQQRTPSLQPQSGAATNTNAAFAGALPAGLRSPAAPPAAAGAAGLAASSGAAGAAVPRALTAAAAEALRSRAGSAAGLLRPTGEMSPCRQRTAGPGDPRDCACQLCAVALSAPLAEQRALAGVAEAEEAEESPPPSRTPEPPGNCRLGSAAGPGEPRAAAVASTAAAAAVSLSGAAANTTAGAVRCDDELVRLPLLPAVAVRQLQQVAIAVPGSAATTSASYAAAASAALAEDASGSVSQSWTWDVSRPLSASALAASGSTPISPFLAPPASGSQARSVSSLAGGAVAGAGAEDGSVSGPDSSPSLHLDAPSLPPSTPLSASASPGSGWWASPAPAAAGLLGGAGMGLGVLGSRRRSHLPPSRRSSNLGRYCECPTITEEPN